jgi:hypothetical protein
VRDVCALVLSDTRHHTPAGGIRRFQGAGVSHPDAFGACQTAQPGVSMTPHHHCLGFLPRCIRARLGSSDLVASWMIGACRSRGWETRAGKPPYRRYCVMIPSIAGQQPKLFRSSGGNLSNRRCEAMDVIPTGTRQRRRIPPPFWWYSGAGILCNPRASVRLCRSLLSFAFHLATLRNHGSEAHDANETGSCSLTLAPVAYWYEPALCAKISFSPCAFGR